MPSVIQVWRPAQFGPSAPTPLHGELALCRDLLGVPKGISRAANAPKVTACGESSLEVVVPEASGEPVLVFPDVTFDDLQTHIPPASETWKLGPAQLGNRGGLVMAPQLTLCLARQLHWDRPGRCYHLLRLPRAHRIERGQREVIDAPALLLVGNGAAQFTADTTQATKGPRQSPVGAYSLEIPEYHYHVGLAALLDQLPSHAVNGLLRVPTRDDTVRAKDMPHVAAELLHLGGEQTAFLPVLEDEHTPLLAFIYSRANGSTGVIFSDPEIRQWLAELIKALHSRARASRPPAFTNTRQEGALARFGDIATRSAAFAKVLEEIQAVGPGETDLLLLGETGTGKEYLARAIHESSRRRNAPFVAVNCALGSDELIQSQLFGHVKGSFTGSVAARGGKFLEADGGTLLLDEIANASEKLQNALLRVLEDRRITPVGSDREHPVDVRVIAATSQSLEERMAAGTFKKDLYYRLAGAEVTIPPLHERTEDLPALCDAILTSSGDNVALSPEALKKLAAHDWPGNVRELVKCLQKAMQLAAARTGAIHKAADLEDPAYDPHRTILKPEHFDFAGAREPIGSEQRLYFYDEAIRAVAARIWRDRELPPVGDRLRNKRRALHRAALLLLDSENPRDTWSRNILNGWERLFGPKWATTEEGRGMKDLLVALSVNVEDAEVFAKAREWVMGRVGKG